MTSKHIESRKACLELRRRARQNPDLPITAWYLEGAWEHRDEIPALREAHGFLRLYQNMELELWPEDRFAGIFLPREAAWFHYGSATYISMPMIDAMIEQQGLSEEDARALREKAQWMDNTRYVPGLSNLFTPEEQASIAASAASSTWFGGHMILDFERILTLGLNGYADIIASSPDTPFYQAMSVQLEALRTLILRFAELARARSETEGYDAARMESLSRILENIAHRPPETFEEAVQLVWLLHAADGSDTFGRFDTYLAPFYEKDIRLGRLTRQQAYDDLVDIWMKIEEVDKIQNMTIGGMLPDGSSAYTDLTRLCLEVTRDVAYKGPNLCLRVAKDMPEDLWDVALDCLQTGIGLPALYHEEAYIHMLERAGYPMEDCRNFCLGGCSQLMIPGQSNFVNDIGMYNMAKIMELTLYGGVDSRTGVQVGLKTPPLSEMRSFDELITAFETQNRYFVALEASINDKDTLYRNEHEGYTMRSLFTRGCLESGKGVFAGGAKYNNIELEIIGITNAADSLYAVKKAVFDEKRFTGEEMLAMLSSNFAGREADRLWLRNKVAKFGNDVAELDALRGRIAGETYRLFNETPAVLGGVYVPGEVIFVAHEPMGAVVGATPDGRLAGTVLADSMGAAQGLDIHGPTALMSSVLRTPAADHLLTTPALNLRFMTSTWKNARTSGTLLSLLREFFRGGGLQMQINVCDGQTLRAALKNPEEYASLVVRVGGYSDYFVKLSPKLQREIITRTEQLLPG